MSAFRCPCGAEFATVERMAKHMGKARVAPSRVARAEHGLVPEPRAFTLGGLDG